jgi:hypothetical protein
MKEKWLARGDVQNCPKNGPNVRQFRDFRGGSPAYRVA